MLNKAAQKSIAHAVSANFSSQVEFLSGIVRAKSPNPYTPQDSPLDEPVEKEVADLIFEKLSEYGFSPRYIGPSKNRANVVVEWGNKRARNSLMLNGHMDTIPPEGNDVISPYSGSVRSGKLHGLGSLDMKGTLSCYLYAAKALKDAGIKLAGKLILAFVVDEESGSCSAYGTQYLLEKGIVPRACIIGEHGSKYVRTGQRGVYRFKLVVKGESVHTGVSAWENGEKGRNAIADMARAINALQDLEIPYKASRTFPGRRPVFTFPTKVVGGSAMNVVPDQCTAYGDVRLMPGNSDSQVKLLIVEKLQKLSIDYEIVDMMFVPAVEIDTKEPIVEFLQKEAKEVLGYVPETKGSGPGTDGWMLIKRDVPTVFGFGPDGSGEHGRGEWVELSSLEKITEIYARTIASFLA
ncbi:MAG: Acetylornithine deacetylase [Microgenomates group bacterium GW2011_GWF2_47_9]|nr:MAG: Acetylornithine deacetylase [Microgenomates group bacterium GW2011_GWF2_47_9]